MSPKKNFIPDFSSTKKQGQNKPGQPAQAQKNAPRPTSVKQPQAMPKSSGHRGGGS